MEKNEFIRNFVEEINEEIKNMENVEILSENDVLIDRGIDSISFVQIVVFIETRYSIEIEDEYLSLECFNTIKDLGNYMWRKVNE